MTRRYTNQEKVNALVQLHVNGDDVSLTADQLGIPERTLYHWFRQWQGENRQQNFSLQLPPIRRPDFAGDLDALAYIRKQIMDELLNMAESFRNDATFATPAQRMKLLSQLLDRMMKLDQHLRPYRPAAEEKIRLTWETGLYLRTESGYRGPYAPDDLPERWKEKYGLNTRLEIYWGDDTFTRLPDDGPILELILTVKSFGEEPCEMDPDMEYEDEYDDGWYANRG
jgi:hypothetical protein